MFRWLRRVADPFYGTLHVELPVPPGMSVADVADVIAGLAARYEALRTTYVDGEPPRQRVAASGVITLEVCALGEGQWGPRDRPPVAEALIRRLRESPDPARPPMRLAVATTAGADQVIACAAAFSHLAVDHGSIEVITRDFADMLRDPVRRQPGEPRHQPLDQAQLEATPAEQRRADRALRYLHTQAQRMPHRMYALPGARPGGESLVVELLSVAAATAARRIATRTRTSRSAIVIAAVCAVLAHRLGTREVVLPLNANNRFERHLIHYVGALSQNGVATIEIGDHSFDALATHTWTTVLEASRQARYDTAERAESDRRTEHERGLLFGHDLLFNSLVSESPLAHRPEVPAPTELRWRPVPWNGTPLRFDLNQIDGRLLLAAWSADTGLVPRAELESLLLAVERLLVAAAAGDLDTTRIPDVIDLAPVVRTEDWLLIDSCWVDLTEVQRLLDAAFSPASARIFRSADGQSLVAYLVATDSVRTPEQAHARCLATLPSHPTAITPRHYVICPTAPPDPTDLTAWPPSLTAGTGRDNKV